MTRRAQWQREVSRTAFPVGMRPVKATLLAIVPLVGTDGTLSVWRDQLVDATGVPSRTIDRHLEKACAVGWLRRVTPGGYKRRAVYVVTSPTEESCAPQTAHSTTILCAMCYAQDCQSCAPRGGELKEESASVSEPGALDRLRRRRDDHDGAGVSRSAPQGQERIYRTDSVLHLVDSVRRPQGGATVLNHNSNRQGELRHDRTAGARRRNLSPGAGRRLACTGLRSVSAPAWTRSVRVS